MLYHAHGHPGLTLSSPIIGSLTAPHHRVPEEGGAAQRPLTGHQLDSSDLEISLNPNHAQDWEIPGLAGVFLHPKRASVLKTSTGLEVRRHGFFSHPWCSLPLGNSPTLCPLSTQQNEGPVSAGVHQITNTTVDLTYHQKAYSQDIASLILQAQVIQIVQIRFR